MDINQSYERYAGGANGNCQDDGDNATDFFLVNPSNPQNSTGPFVLCGEPTPTPEASNTPIITNTPTITQTSTVTPVIGPLSVLINEVAWAGTSSTRTSDEWIELYNTLPFEISLNNWKMTIDKGEGEIDFVTFNTDDKIPADGYFLLGRALNIFTNVIVDKAFSEALPNTGIIVLRLYNAQGTFIDSANLGRQSGWYAGSASPNYASMERRGKILDGVNAWFTFGGTPFALNRDNASVRGTPKQANWAVNVTPTPTVFRTPTPTSTPSRTPTITIDPRPIINEILARPGFDWNRDGRVDVLDEFIEIKNLTAIDINLGGWVLDKADSGASFTLPSRTLKPGERAVFYGSDTGLLLSDGGETIRLISPGGKIYDAYTYAFARTADQSFCRLPDGNVFGSWFEDCLPTPNLANTREGEVPAMPGGAYESPVCSLPDTIPADFFLAECHGYGANIWNPFYWDQLGGQGWRIIPANTGKWASIIE